jgi:hypothetical protein
METIALATQTELNQIPFFSEDPLITRIFGLKEYKYNLKLKHDFPEVIYKERNLNLTVRLCNPDERPIFNGRYLFTQPILSIFVLESAPLRASGL